MKPIPAENDPQPERSDSNSSARASSMSTLLGSTSSGNRRIHKTPPVIRAYPLLLLASTLTAAIFFTLYITKPVIVYGEPESFAETDAETKADGKKPNLIPDPKQLPGEGETDNSSKPGLLTSPIVDQYEETNLRIQHILTAESPDGYTGRIDIDVPVLYQSRQLRWTSEEVKQARQLLSELKSYQSKSRQLRSEGDALLQAWNALISNSIPGPQLRADSPSLPENQAGNDSASGNDFTAESIQIETSEP